MAFMIPAFLSKPLAFITSNWAKIKLAATVITLGTGIKGFMEGKALMAKGQDILGQKTSQGGKIPVIYGRRRVGSTVIFMHTADNRSKDLFVVYALSVGEIDQIELDTIEINGVPIKDPKVFRQGYYAGSDKIASGAGSLCTFDQRGTVTAENAGGSGTDPAQRYRMVFNAHHGADDQTADPMLVASSGGQWTSSHRARGIAYLACSYEYDNKGMFNSIPQLTVVCRGKKLYDPRKDGSITGGTGSHRYSTPSTFEWSDNAALCLLDYMRDSEYGKGLAETDINLQTFQSAATTAETKQDTPDFDGSYSNATFSGDAGVGVITVDGDTWKTSKIGGNLNLKDASGNIEFEDNVIVDATRYQPFDSNAIYQLVVQNPLSNSYTNEAGEALVKVERFSCNGVVDANKNILENTQELLANMRGILNYINGKYEITLEDTASSTFTVTDDHIIGDSGITVTYEDKAQKANKVVVQFFNALKKYEMDTATVLHDASPNFTSDDGGEELELVVDFPHVVNKYVAYNMGKAILGRSRSQMTISFTGTPELYKTKVGDVITVVYTPVGFTGKLFRIESMTLQPDGLIAIQAIEYLDIYTWQAPPQEIIEPINNPVAYFAVKAPTGITFTDAGSSSTGRSFLTWDEPTDYPNHQYRIRIVDSSSNKLTNKIVDQEFVDLNYLPVGSNYVASVSAINSINEESSAATLTFSVSTPPVATADIKDDAVTTNKILDDAVNSLKLADDAVTNAKIAVDAIQGDVIAAGAITEAKLGVDAVTNAKLADNSVNTAQIVADAITTAKIAIGAITSTELGVDAVTNAKIADNAVQTAQISASAITTAKIANDAVTNALIATDAVNQDSIAANSVTATQIVAGTITASEIAANAITTDKINAGAITTAKINAGAITATEIASNAITAVKIAADAVTADKVAANAIVANSIVSNAITSDKIIANAITTAKINAGAVTADTIATNAITAIKITTDAITSDKIQANAITSAKILAGEITAGKLAADSIVASNIQAGQITGVKIAADAVDADKINVTTLSAITANMGTVTAGTFKTADSGYRVEVSDTGGFPIWYGTGTKTAGNALFYVDTSGAVYINAVVVAQAGSTVAFFNASVAAIFKLAFTSSITTNAAVVTLTNGTGPYTYSWTRQITTQGPTPTISSSTSASPTFTATGMVVGVDSTSIWNVLVTDTDNSATSTAQAYVTIIRDA
jgi:hypothetical protein